MRTSIWWIRRDLRLAGNPALEAAIQGGGAVVPVFVLDPALLASPYAGEKRVAFLLAGLRELDASLRERGSSLVVRRGRPVEVLQSLSAETGAEGIFAEADVTPYAAKRDREVEASLPVTWYGSPAVYPPGSVSHPDGRPYKTFTPFSKAWKALPGLQPGLRLSTPARILTPPVIHSEPLPDLPRLPQSVPFAAGEAEAKRRLEAFTTGEDAPVYRYAEGRNRLDQEGTSQLSPYLRFGMISARQAAAAARLAIEEAPSVEERQGAETWLNELIWREFFLHILDHFPQARRENFRMKNIAWRNNPSEFKAWKEGRTGYPVVDAAMRQLIATGWMHNRARMVAASFLTKHLLVDWRWGEQWFMQHLLDGDPASNNGGWQWTAGTGTDAAPYFRIFNPVSQGIKHDPSGEFVRRWVPELHGVPLEYLHQPWTMPQEIQRSSGCQIGQEYPAPIVEHGFARQRALEVYGHA